MNQHQVHETRRELAKLFLFGPNQNDKNQQHRQVMVVDPPGLDVRSVHFQYVLSQRKRRVVIQQPNLKQQLDGPVVRSDEKQQDRPQKKHDVGFESKSRVRYFQLEPLALHVLLDVDFAQPEANVVTVFVCRRRKGKCKLNNFCATRTTHSTCMLVFDRSGKPPAIILPSNLLQNEMKTKSVLTTIRRQSIIYEYSCKQKKNKYIVCIFAPNFVGREVILFPSMRLIKKTKK